MTAPSDEQDGDQDKGGSATGDKFYIPCGDNDMRRGTMANPYLSQVNAMPRRLLAALAFFALSTGLAQAQFSGPYAYQDSHTSGFNIVPEYEGRRSYADIQRDLEIERRYKETLRTRIPDKKPSNDPWRGVRAAPASADRHRAE